MCSARDVVDLCARLSAQITQELNEHRKEKQANSRSQNTIHPRHGLADIPDRSIYIRDPVERERRHQEWIEACRRQQDIQDRMEADRAQREAEVQAERELKKQQALKAKAEKDRLERIKEYTDFKKRKHQMKAAVQKFRLSRLPNSNPTSANELTPIAAASTSIIAPPTTYTAVPAATLMTDDTLKENIPPWNDSGVPPTSTKQISHSLTQPPAPLRPRKAVSRKAKAKFPVAIAPSNNPDPSTTAHATAVETVPPKRGRSRKNNDK